MALPFYPLVFMNLLFAATTLCLARPSRASAAATVAAAVLWIFGNGPLEGQVLWEFDATHGLTVSDLLSVAAVAIAVWTPLDHRGPTVGSTKRATPENAVPDPVLTGSASQGRPDHPQHPR